MLNGYLSKLFWIKLHLWFNKMNIMDIVAPVNAMLFGFDPRFV